MKKKILGNIQRWGCLRAVPAFLIFSFCLSSFDLLKPAAPVKDPKPAAKPEGAVSAASDEFMTAGQKFNFHRWIVREMIEQVFGRPAKDQAEVDGWANVFSQKGSMEGVYHGLVYSSDYAALEQGKADLKAIRFFAQEMAALDNPNSTDTDAKPKADAERYAKEYMGTSLFTLKRLLGERIITESTARKDDKDRLATWYANFVSRWAKAGVPFGLPERNKDNEAYHFRWAKDNGLGLIQWELLNRVHRILNNYGGLPPIPAPAAAESQAAKPAAKSP